MNKLKSLRLEHNLTIYDMATKLNISVPYYSQIENKKRGLSYIKALQIAEVFKLKPDDIFYEENKKTKT